MDTWYFLNECLFMKQTCRSTCPGCKHDAVFLRKNVIRVEQKMSPIVGKKGIPLRHLTTKWDSNHQTGLVPNLFNIVGNVILSNYNIICKYLNSQVLGDGNHPTPKPPNIHPPPPIFHHSTSSENNTTGSI